MNRYVFLIIIPGLIIWQTALLKHRNQDIEEYYFDFCDRLYSYSPDTIKAYTNDGRYIEIKISKDATLTWFKMKKKIAPRQYVDSLEGYYSRSHDRHDTILYYTSYGTDTGRLKVNTFYYRPVRDSVWKYYDKAGNFLETKRYERGVLIN
jgi:hypothetical protein